jgi:hypothetical protein
MHALYSSRSVSRHPPILTWMIRNIGWCLCTYFCVITSIYGQTTFVPAEEVIRSMINYTQINMIDYSQDPMIRIFHLVVKDKSGNFITGAGAEDQKQRIFQGFQGCKDLLIKEVNERQDVRQPYSFAIVLDYSGSMEYLEKDVFDGTTSFLKRLNPDDSIAIFRFNNTTELVSPPTSVPSELWGRMRLMDRKCSGGTALLQAVKDAALHLSSTALYRRRVIFVLTDGMGDAEESVSIAQLGHICDQNSVYVFPILIGGESGKETLLKMAEKCGGRLSVGIKANETDSIFTEIYRKLQNHYHVTCVEPSADAGFYEDGVKVTPSPGSSDVPHKSIPPVFPKGEFKKTPELEKQVKLQLDGFIPYLKQHPECELYIYGHASSDGKEVDNMLLSMNRAMVVWAIAYPYLVEKLGFEPQIKIKGFGHKESRFPPDAPESQLATDRRVEIGILSPPK